MMGWRFSIRPASFRGVNFGVLSGELEAGRRTVLHEFPQRDMPYAEDMGAAPQKFTLEAFVLGSDYLSRRDKLENALRNPASGTLVHPWYGEIEVAQFAPYKVRHSAQDGGMCVFSLSFVRVEKPQSPAASVNPGLRALMAAAEAVSFVAEVYDSTISLVSQTAYVISETKNLFSRAISIVKGFIGGNFINLDNLIGGLPGGSSSGESFAAAFSGLAAGSNTEAVCLAWARAAAADYPIPDPPHAGSARKTIRQNGLAFVSLIRQLAIIEACRIAAGVVPASRKSAQILKDAIMDGFDAALNLNLPVYPAETVLDVEKNPVSTPESITPELTARLTNALIETRDYALAALAKASAAAPEIETIMPGRVLPCLALAYRYGGDAALAADLVDRNSIVHPGFVPVKSIEVLRR